MQVSRVVAVTSAVLVGGAAVAAAASLAGARPVEAGASRCVVVRAAVRGAISTGLNHGARLRAARAVRSRDFKSVYFVSADLQGPGLRGKNEIATWATNKMRL